MRNLKPFSVCSAITAALFVVAGAAQAGVVIDFKGLADGGLGESAWTTLMFEADGSHTTNVGDAFLKITGTNGSDSYAYLDSDNAGLGVCGALTSSAQSSGNFDKANPNTGTNLCNPSSDDNISYHNGTPEMLHFDFLDAVTVDRIWVNNNHDGDKSLLNDSILVGIGGGDVMQLTNGGASADSELMLNLLVGAADLLDVGFYEQDCGGPSADNPYGNCELYVSKIEFTRRDPGPGPGSDVPAPATLALLSLGLTGIAWRRRQVRV